MTNTSNKGGQMLLGASALLWIIWGLVHMLAGMLTIAQDATAAVQGIADAVDPALLDVTYPAAADALINQHGFNLLWIGLVTALCSYFIWRRSAAAIFLAALVGGLTDIGYFIYMDLGGFVKFAPGTVMTIVSSLAVLSSFYVWFRHMRVN